MTVRNAIRQFCNPQAASAAWGTPFVNAASALERAR
jgi:hypothetical protein